MKFSNLIYLALIICLVSLSTFSATETDEAAAYQAPSHRISTSDDPAADVQKENPTELREYSGSCHCKAVTFKVHAPSHISAFECNCSICDKTGFLHLLVPKEAFTLLSGEDSLTTYRFNTMQAQHTFCKVCGVKSFYQPRSHPNDYSVNLRCLDTSGSLSVKVSPFDGKNWEASISELPKSLTEKNG